MKRGKNNSYLVIAALAALVAASAVLIGQDERSLFPEKLAGMELKLHREGDVAIREVKNSHSGMDNVSPNEAHIARYRSSTGNRATVSVTAAETHQQAVEKVENMNRGMGGMFSKPETVEMNGLYIYYTEGGGEYHYYYAKNHLVVWMALSNPDKTYQSMVMKQAVETIGG